MKAVVRRVRLLAALVLLGGSLWCTPLAVGTVSAQYDPLNEVCQSGSASSKSSSCQSRTVNNPLIGANGLLHKVSRIIAMVGGLSAVIVMIVAGLNYMTTNGDAQKVSHAKDIIRGALIGLVIIALAQGIIEFVMSRI